MSLHADGALDSRDVLRLSRFGAHEPLVGLHLDDLETQLKT